MLSLLRQCFWFWFRLLLHLSCDNSSVELLQRLFHLHERGHTAFKTRWNQNTLFVFIINCLICTRFIIKKPLLKDMKANILGVSWLVAPAWSYRSVFTGVLALFRDKLAFRLNQLMTSLARLENILNKVRSPANQLSLVYVFSGGTRDCFYNIQLKCNIFLSVTSMKTN